jgi:hypothetical protein
MDSWNARSSYLSFALLAVLSFQTIIPYALNASDLKDISKTGNGNEPYEDKGIVQPHNELPEGVAFSVNAGFYTSSFELMLTHPDGDAVIHYTLDGSLPDHNSPVYTGPLNIKDRSGEENKYSMIPTNHIDGLHGWKEPAGKIAKGNVVRARAIIPGYPDGPVSSATYFVFPEGRERYSMDVISIITDPANLFSDSSGIYVPGDSFTGRESTGNYFGRGEEWERPASFELFRDGSVFSQDIGIRIHGGWTRRVPVKSLRLYARSKYGASRFNFQVFPDQPQTGFNRLILRNSGNDYFVTMFKDALAQILVNHLDPDTQSYRPAVVFINGEFWGIKNIRERYDRHYLARVYGVDPENIDLLTDTGTVIEGDNSCYIQMLEFIENNDLSVEDNYKRVAEMMDIDNFLDYYSSQIFFANTDWPSNNIDYWRLRTGYDPFAPKGHDGRWRWLLYDVDRAMSLKSFNMISHLTAENNDPENNRHNLILRCLLENENFSNSFINSIADHLNTTFLPSRINSVIDSISNLVEPEIDEHINRWGYPVSRDFWDDQVIKMYEDASDRPWYVIYYLMQHFGIDTTVTVTVTGSSGDMGYIRVNSVDVKPSTPGVTGGESWTGTYFYGIPVEIEAIPSEGCIFSHWTGNIPDTLLTNMVLNITPLADIDLEAHFVYTETPELISSWFFGTDLPNDTPLETIYPVYSRFQDTKLSYRSSLEGYPFEQGHPNWRKASLERRNAPTEINYNHQANNGTPYDNSDMRGVQVKQPLAEGERQNTIIFHLPTTGYKDIFFSFAAIDEGAAGSINTDCSVSGNEQDWISVGAGYDTMNLYGTYHLYELDLSVLEEAFDNPDLKLRIRFDAEDMYVDEGNRVTFNNFSLHGTPADPAGIGLPQPQAGRTTDPDDEMIEIIYPNPAGSTLSVRLRRALTDFATVSLVTVDGSVIIEQIIDAGTITIILNVEDPGPGIYFLSLKTGNYYETAPVIIK